MTTDTNTLAPVERIMLSLPKELLDRLTAIAKSRGLSRASYIRMLLTDNVNAIEFQEKTAHIWESPKQERES